MVIKIDKAAKLLSLNVKQLKKALKRYEIPHIRLSGEHYIFNVEDLKRWVEQCQIKQEQKN